MVIAIGGVFELLAVGMGAYVGGLIGLSVGWLGVVAVEATYMLRDVYTAAFPDRQTRWRRAGNIAPSQRL
jgi:hypothetical protein